VQENESLAINPAVHFNEWANFSKTDFIPVLAAWKQFLALFSCENSICESRIYVVGSTKEKLDFWTLSYSVDLHRCSSQARQLPELGLVA